MLGKDLIAYLKNNHLEDAEVRVFSSEKWRWITAEGCIHHNKHVVQIDAKYLSDEHVEQLKEHTYDCPSL